MGVRALGAEDPSPALNAREPARPVAAALHPGAAQVQPARPACLLTRRTPPRGRSELLGAGPRRPRPRPSCPRPHLHPKRYPLPSDGSGGSGRGCAGPPHSSPHPAPIQPRPWVCAHRAGPEGLDPFPRLLHLRPRRRERRRARQRSCEVNSIRPDNRVIPIQPLGPAPREFLPGGDHRGSPGRGRETGPRKRRSLGRGRGRGEETETNKERKGQDRGRCTDGDEDETRTREEGWRRGQEEETGTAMETKVNHGLEKSRGGDGDKAGTERGTEKGRQAAWRQKAEG